MFLNLSFFINSQFFLLYTHHTLTFYLPLSHFLSYTYTHTHSFTDTHLTLSLSTTVTHTHTHAHTHSLPFSDTSLDRPTGRLPCIEKEVIETTEKIFNPFTHSLSPTLSLYHTHTHMHTHLSTHSVLGLFQNPFLG
jgi:hypothetical protein